MARLRSHGITRYAEDMTHVPDGPWYYQQIDLGFNYRMTDFQAALGLSQLRRLDAFVARRHELARRYDQLLKGSMAQTPWQHPDSYSGMHLYVVRVPAESRRQIFESLRSGGVGVNLHYIPVYRQPYYESLGYQRSQFPAAEAYYAQAITLPLYPGLEETQQDQVVRQLLSPTGYQTLF
jgi:dTDP-4-amino-4,6-dideoxygalactose transaminase